jgi:muramidase (phage lysozyme)
MGSSTIKNPTSTASGYYQFLDSSWETYGKQLWGDHLKDHDKLNRTDSTILAAYVFGKNGTQDWLESKPCWNK